MRKYGTIIVSVAVMSIFLVASVGSAASVKIGLVDTKRVIEEARAAQAARTAIYKDIKDKQAVFSEKQADVMALSVELRKQKETLDAVTFAEKSDALEKELNNLSRLKEDLEDELNEKNVALTRKILQEVWKIVKDFRKDNNYTFIMEADKVVSADEKVDITDDIIRVYDKMYKNKVQ